MRATPTLARLFGNDAGEDEDESILVSYFVAAHHSAFDARGAHAGDRGLARRLEAGRIHSAATRVLRKNWMRQKKLVNTQQAEYRPYKVA